MVTVRTKRAVRILICIILALFINMTGLCGPGSLKAEVDSRAIRSAAVSYLQQVQNMDGGFPARLGEQSSRAVSDWVLMALAVSRSNTASSTDDCIEAALHFAAENAQDLSTTTDYARALIALSAAGAGDVSGGPDLAAKIASLQQDSGQFALPGEEGFMNTHMWSVLALYTAGADMPEPNKAREWLIQRQNSDGGFGWYEGIDSDVDDTAVAVQALLVLGEKADHSDVLKKALAYIKSCQVDDGGFCSGWTGRKSNLSSSSWAVMAIRAAGEDPDSMEWSVNGTSGIDYISSLQSKEGYFYWMPETLSAPVNTTAYAVLALSGQYFPLTAPVSDQGEVGTSPFADLNSSYWAFNEMMDLVNRGVISGYEDQSIRPDRHLTRAEFSKYLVCSLGLDKEPAPNQVTFGDVPRDHWAYGSISIAAGRGYLKGRPDGGFDPEGTINGAEMAVILARALTGTDPTVQSQPCWYTQAVEICHEYHLLSPYYQDMAPVTRAECAYSMVQLLNNPEVKSE